MDTLFRRSYFWNELIDMDPLKDLKFNIPQVVAYTTLVVTVVSGWVSLKGDVNGIREDLAGEKARTAELQKIVIQMNENGTWASRNELSHDRVILESLTKKMMDMEQRALINMPRFERMDINVENLLKDRGLTPAPKK